MQWIGEQSFSVYLIHSFVVHQLWQHGIYEKLYTMLGRIGSFAFYFA